MQLGQRARTEVDDGAFAGAFAVVDQVIAWPIFAIARARLEAFLAAEDQGAELEALRQMYALYAAEAQPAWLLEDGHGPIPPTADGMLRLPVALAQLLYTLWLETFGAAAEEPVEAAAPPEPLAAAAAPEPRRRSARKVT